jgi:hypothetical protein
MLLRQERASMKMRPGMLDDDARARRDADLGAPSRRVTEAASAEFVDDPGCRWREQPERIRIINRPAIHA